MPWRPLPDGEAPLPRPVKASLDALSRAMGGPAAGPLAGVFEHWEEVVGPAVAAHTRPLTWRHGVLTLSVDDPAWAAQLGYMEAQLRHQVEAVAGVGTVQKVVLKVRR